MGGEPQFEGGIEGMGGACSICQHPDTDVGNIGDLIWREDALKLLHEFFDGMLETDTWSPQDLYNLFDVIPSAAVHDSAKDVGWIPVKDRLPDIGVEVLTSSDGGWIEIQSLELNDGMKLWENRYGYWQGFEGVKAWKPLPEPWEGEKNG